MNNIIKSNLINALFEAEGAELENVECIAVPSKAFSRRIRRFADHPEKFAKNRRVKKAVIILIAAVVILTGCTAIKPIRTTIVNFIVTIFKDGTFVDKSTKKNVKDIITEFYTPGYIPEGYEFDEEEIEKYDENHIILRELKYKKEDKYLYFTQLTAKTTMTLDTENAEIKTFKVNGIECMSSRNLNCYIVIWEQDGYRFRLTTLEDITEETAIKIIESVEKIEFTNN